MIGPLARDIPRVIYSGEWRAERAFCEMFGIGLSNDTAEDFHDPWFNHEMYYRYFDGLGEFSAFPERASKDIELFVRDQYSNRRNLDELVAVAVEAGRKHWDALAADVEVWRLNVEDREIPPPAGELTPLTQEQSDELFKDWKKR